MAQNAQAKMKALVVSRLLLGDINDWQVFERERGIAAKILNRRTARSVSAQIGRSYGELSSEMQSFIDKNFSLSSYDELARLCDAIPENIGLNLRLDEFEKQFFPLNDSVKRRFPFYTHVRVSTYGLQFEFPEHHFMTDLETGFEELKEIGKQVQSLGITDANMKKMRNDIAPLVSREKFVSRSVVSAAFSLVESFVSGLFYTALHLKTLGKIPCDDGFLGYAAKKESAALKERIARIVDFASHGKANGDDDPFKSFIKIGKFFRDAIHHTTPFERKSQDLEAGQRLEALYGIKADVALMCSLLALDSVSKISQWLHGENRESAIFGTCDALRDAMLVYSVEQGFALPPRSD